MAQKLIIANFKSNKTREEYESWMDSFEKSAKSLPRHTIILAPPFVDLMFISNRLLDKKVHADTALATQDLSPFPAGAYTGAVSVRNLEGFNVSYAIVGHSERRTYFHETNNDVANKAREALIAGITPIVCVTKDTIQTQAHTLETTDRKRVIVAFEPMDHIGTGIADTLEDILETRKLVMAAFGDVKYVYGGSVDPDTDAAILSNPNIDGFLVGGASLDAHKFINLVSAIS